LTILAIRQAKQGRGIDGLLQEVDRAIDEGELGAAGVHASEAHIRRVPIA
jgi:hypothetical protein